MATVDQNALAVGMMMAKRRSQKLIIVFLSAGVLAVAALFILVFSTTPAAPGAAAVVASVEEVARMATSKVLIPSDTISAGQKLERVMFTVETRPANEVNSRMITDFFKIEGYYSKANIPPGVPLLMDDVSPVPVRGVSGNIPAGFRAVTINVDTLSSVEGWVRPGSHVDVSWIAPIRGQASLTVIMQNLLILSAERQTQGQAIGAPLAAVPSTVTLLVNEGEAQKLILATTTGKLSLSLRGDMDTKIYNDFHTVTLGDLLGGVRSVDADKRKNSARITFRDANDDAARAVEVDSAGRIRRD